jgi:hypothetical protein
VGGESVSPAAFNLQNLRGQTLLFRCLKTGFVTTALAQTRYQKHGALIHHGENWWANALPNGAEVAP